MYYVLCKVWLSSSRNDFIGSVPVHWALMRSANFRVVPLSSYAHFQRAATVLNMYGTSVSE